VRLLGDGRLELREGGPERVVGIEVVDVVVVGAEEEVRVEAVELGDGSGRCAWRGAKGWVDAGAESSGSAPGPGYTCWPER
jgi:hypothetical protein